MKKKSILGAFLSLAIMSLFGCGGGGGGGSAAPPAGTTISGVAAKGPINGGVVKVFEVKADGTVDTTNDTPIGSGNTATDGSGKYVATLTKVPTGPVVVEVSGGSYTDEATGAAGVPLKAILRTAVSSIANGSKVAITPLTDLAFRQTKQIGTFSKENIDASNKQIALFFKVDDIILSQPFDATKDKPSDASPDDQRYAAALGIFSELVENSRVAGADKTEDLLIKVLDDIEAEFRIEGGITSATLADINIAITDFSGKNKGGLPPTAIVFRGGVLQLSTAGTLASSAKINGFDITITFPAGVTLKTKDATGEVAAGVVEPSSLAATNSVTSAKFTAASGSTPATLHVGMANVQPGLAIGEFMHVNFDLDAGLSLPGKDKFIMSNVQILGGSDPLATPTALSGISITTTLAGL